jgi:hypothetical protein
MDCSKDPQRLLTRRIWEPWVRGEKINGNQKEVEEKSRGKTAGNRLATAVLFEAISSQYIHGTLACPSTT